MFDDTAGKILERIKSEFDINEDKLSKIKEIIADEIHPIQIIAENNISYESLSEDDVNLIQIQTGHLNLSSFDLHRLSKKLSKEFKGTRRTFIIGYIGEKLDVSHIKKGEAYLIKIPMGSMSDIQKENTRNYYENKIGKLMREQGYNVSFIEG